MIEMQCGETTIKVMPDRVAEMQRKGWVIADEIPAQGDIQDSEDLEDGDAHGF